jgi:hypothetical protein
MRGRTVSSHGQLFGPFLVSGAVTAVPPVPPAPTAAGGGRRSRGRPYPRWWLFQDEIERMDEEELLELDEI